MTTVNDIQTKIGGSWTSLNIPKVLNGTTEPSSSTGKNGDLYIQYNSSESTGNSMTAIWSKINDEWLSSYGVRDVIMVYTFDELKTALTTTHDVSTVIKLGADIISTSEIECSGIYNNLNLNGHNITSDGTNHPFLKLYQSTLILDGNGYIQNFQHSASQISRTHIIWVYYNSSLTMLNGTISNNTMSCNTYMGGGIILLESGSSSGSYPANFTMHGGSICNNICNTITTSSSFNGSACGIANTSSYNTITLQGGSITGNSGTSTQSNSAGGIYSLSKVSISGNVNIINNYIGSNSSNIVGSINLMGYITGQVKSSQNNTLGSTFGTCTEGSLYAYNIKSEDESLQGSVSGTNLVWVGVSQ